MIIPVVAQSQISSVHGNYRQGQEFKLDYSQPYAKNWVRDKVVKPLVSLPEEVVQSTPEIELVPGNPEGVVPPSFNMPSLARAESPAETPVLPRKPRS